VFYLVLTSLWDVVQRRLERHYGRGYAPTQAKAPAAGVPVAA
jgi:polar amino acid transport system permease protein